MLVSQAPPLGLNVRMARTSPWRCMHVFDVLKVVRRAAKGPLRRFIIEDNYRAIEADQKFLRGPIIPAHFHSMYNGTDNPSDLIKPRGATNAIPRAEVGPGHRHG